MSPYPDAFLDSFGEGARPAHKSKIWPKLQKEMTTTNDIFTVCGFPNIYNSTAQTPESAVQSIIVWAIDLMNTVHYPIEFEQALTVRMHVEKSASNAVRHVIRNNCSLLTRTGYLDSICIVIIRGG